MSDVEYRFIRGKGWVPQGNPDEVVGVKYTVLRRPPRLGESFGIFPIHDKKWVIDGKLDLVALSEHLEKLPHIDGYSVVRDEAEYRKYYSVGFVNCTIIPND